MKNFKQKISAGIISLIFLLGLTIAIIPLTPIPITHAQTQTCKEQNANGQLCIPKPRTLPGPTDTNQNKNYFRDVLLVQITKTLVSLAGGFALLFFIFGGIQMLTAFGNDDQITKSKKTMIWAIVGFLLAMFSYTIVSIIGNIEITPNQRTGSVTTIPDAQPTTSTTTDKNIPPPPPATKP